MKVIDLTRVLTRDLDQKWVALSKDNKRVIASGDKLSYVKTQVGKEKVVYMKVPLTSNCAFLRK